MAGQLTRIDEGLRALARRDASLRGFGASAHRHLRLAPFDEPTIAAFERRTGVALPASYRSFVTTVASGGAGPGYGLQWSPAIEVDGWEATFAAMLPDPAARAAVEAGLAPDFAALADLPESVRPYVEERLSTPGYARLRLERVVVDLGASAARHRSDPGGIARPFGGGGEILTTGGLVLCELGCGTFAFLVVTGDGAGTVRTGDREPPHFEDRATDFLDWFEAWLEAALAAPPSPGQSF